jgi:hypothetical protein
MWDSIPRKLQEEWKIFYELEPDELERADWNFAHVVQVVARTGKSLRDYVLPFGDRPVVTIVQSVEQQEKLIDAWIFASNAAFLQKRH